MMPANSNDDDTKLLGQVVEQLRDLNAQVRELKAEARGANQRLDATNQRLDATNQRLDALRTELKAEISQSRDQAASNLLASEVRHATRTIEQTAATRDLHNMLVERFEMRDRLERCEHDIADLKRDRAKG